MKYRIYFLILIVLVIIVIAVFYRDKWDLAEAETAVIEWRGKEIIFPSKVRCTYWGRDTVCADIKTPYKVLLYTDSIGCISCKLQLYKWNSLIEMTDKLMVGQLSFLFYFHPKDEDYLQSLLKRQDFRHNVFIDSEDKLNTENNLPVDMKYQCFLLDKDNKIILVGNPTMNPDIWSLYKKIIMGEEFNERNDMSITTVGIKQEELELYGLKVHETTTGTIILENTGNVPLLIKDITTSCGCTVPIWNRQPIKPGFKTEIKIEITPDTSGYLWKTVTIFCNIEKGYIRLTVKGMVNDLKKEVVQR